MSSTIRARPSATKTRDPNPDNDDNDSDSASSPREYEVTIDPSERISRTPSLLDLVRILLGLLFLSTTLSYFVTSSSPTWGYRPAWSRPARIRAWLRGPITLTPHQLSLYNGTHHPHLPIYLALNGSIYDVSASPHLYGPGGAYAFFAGRDATRAFVTGCFDPDNLNGDLRGVEEMFLPLDEDDEDDDEDPGGEEVEAKKVKKVRREREMRLARNRVRDAVRGWEALFDGGKGGRYFWVGRVDRRGEEEGWGERKGLCERAREGRRRRGEEEVERRGVRRAEDVG